jgi:hypothetical protein
MMVSSLARLEMQSARLEQRGRVFFGVLQPATTTKGTKTIDKHLGARFIFLRQRVG